MPGLWSGDDAFGRTGGWEFAGRFNRTKAAIHQLPDRGSSKTKAEWESSNTRLKVSIPASSF
jgi:hypothetical protein